MTARPSTRIQGVARINPECHGSSDRNVILEIGYGKKRKKSTVKNMPFTAIY